MSTDANELIPNDLEPLAVVPLPVIDVVGPRIPTLEVAAIATAVFALVLAYLLWVDVGAEVIWLVVLVLAAGRGRWMESGLDLELPERPTRRHLSSQETSARTLARPSRAARALR